MKYMFFIRMSDLHAMPITSITKSVCYTVEMGVSARDFARIIQKSYSLYECLSAGYRLCVSKSTRRNWCNYRHQRVQTSSVLKIKIMQPSSRTYFSFAIITPYENQITPRRRTRSILKWKSTMQMNRMIMRLYEWYKAKTFCCAFFAAAMMTMVAAATIVRFLPVLT